MFFFFELCILISRETYNMIIDKKKKKSKDKFGGDE